MNKKSEVAMKTVLDQDLLAPVENWGGTARRIDDQVPSAARADTDLVARRPGKPSSTQYLEIEFPELAISAFGENDQELRSCVHGDIRCA